MPEIFFRRSKLYEAALKRNPEFDDIPDKKYKTKIHELESDWNGWGAKIFAEIEAVSRLHWHEKEIVCYVIAGFRAYSDPLTLNLRSNIDTLTHELIHRILSEPKNRELVGTGWDKLMGEYAAEPQVTRTHIVVHAIHAAVLKNLFGEERYEYERRFSTAPEYIRAWEIVERDGYQKIIDSLHAK